MPERLGDRGWVLLIAGIALAVRLPLIAVSGSVSYAGDTAEYMQLADQITRGHFATDYRMPGYPLFIAFVDLLPGDRAGAVVTIQHLIGVAVVAAIVYFGSRWLGRAAAVTAGLLAAITPVMLGLEHMLQPDFLFATWMLAGSILLVLALSPPRPSVSLLLATAAALAAATYVKPVGAAAIAGVVLGALAGTRSLRQTALAGAVVAGMMALLLVPWAARNEIAHGHFTLSTQGGQTLFKRVFDVDRRPIPTSTADGRLVARLKSEKARRRDHRELNSYVSEELQRHGYSPDGAVAVERRVAVTAIEDAPFAYLAATPARVSDFLTDLNSFSYGDATGGENTSGFDPSEKPAPLRLAIQVWFGVGKALSEAWWILSLHVVAGLLILLSWKRRTRVAAAVMASLWLSIALATALSHGGLRRYSAQMAPEAWLLGAAGATLVVGALAAALRQSRDSA
jgi:4-amino-4-deoxy-L-arabinose transferase-like glycosyltransferase